MNIDLVVIILSARDQDVSAEMSPLPNKKAFYVWGSLHKAINSQHKLLLES